MEESAKDDIQPAPSENEPQETVLDLGDGFKLPFIKRAGWSADLPMSTTENTWPVSFVRLTTTKFRSCFDSNDCKKNIQNIQKVHMDSGLDDIAHNFIIGGDQKVYEGRGFSWTPLLPDEFANLNKTCIEIAFAGTYDFSEPPYHMVMIALDLIKHCIKNRIVDPKFELIPLPEVKPPREK